MFCTCTGCLTGRQKSWNRWAEWNGRYRDDARQFWRGDAGTLGAMATRLAGSSDLYQGTGRTPYCSINFITSHDGFTLNDLVSYRGKHNLANGEDNRDGDNHNCSDNYGVEGPTNNPLIESLRKRQIKNMMATLLLSQGVPMIVSAMSRMFGWVSRWLKTAGPALRLASAGISCNSGSEMSRCW